MKTNMIFKRKVGLGLLFISAVIIGVAGCKKGTFDINNVNPNAPSSVPASFQLSSALTQSATLMYASANYNTADVFENWMGYWMQSGGFTPSTVYALYQVTSGNYVGNFEDAYLNLANYKLIQNTAGSDPTQSYYKAISMIMTSFVYQRLVDIYDKVPYSQASIVNSQFSYKYDDGQTIYNSIYAKIDSAIAIINTGLSASVSPTGPGSSDVMFNNSTGGIAVATEMGNWIKFGNTLKLKILMRQTESASAGKPNIATALTGLTASSFLGAGTDAAVNPGYSSASNADLALIYYDVVANASGGAGLNSTYFVANSYAVNFFKTHGDTLRLKAIYIPKDAPGLAGTSGAVLGRPYGSNAGNETNTTIALIRGTGFDATGSYKGPTQSTYILPAFESLFLQAEAIQRGYLTGTLTTTYNSAVAESFRLLGLPAAAAATYTSQDDGTTNITASTDKLKTIITQKWAACNSIDPLESYSDWRRLNIPSDLPVSVYPGNTAPHIPYRLPYPASEVSFNSSNVPAGAGTDLFGTNSHIFWMPAAPESN